MTRRLAVAALRTLGRAVADEVCLWLRWTLRIVALGLILAAAWSWWIKPAITAEIARQRAELAADVRGAITPPHLNLDDLKNKIRGNR